MIQSDSIHQNLIDQFKLGDNRSEEEVFLNDIVTRLSDLKVSGAPLSDSELIDADDLRRGSQMFNLAKFSPQVQRDILLSLAYFRSPAFEERTALSLGYHSSSADMSETDAELYNTVVDRAKNAYNEISFEVCDYPLQSRTDFKEDGKSVVFIPNGYETPSAVFDSLGFITHEIAHHIYNPNNINPGVYHQGEGESLGNSDSYGSSTSPLNRINETEPDKEQAMKLYGSVVAATAWHVYDKGFMSKEDYKEAKRAFSKIRFGDDSEFDKFIISCLPHDNTGYERAADVHAARMIMLREGIWNPFGKELLTTKHIEEFRERHQDSRIFEYWNNREATYYLNTIAQKTIDDVPVMEQYSDKNPNKGKSLSEMLSSIASGNYEQISRTANDVQREERSAGIHI